MKRLVTMKRLLTFTLTLSLPLIVALWQVSHKAQAVNLAPFATITVTNTNDSGVGSLRQAIADAAPGDTISFNLSNCPCTIALTSGELVIDKSLTIQGLGAKQLTVSGGGVSRVFNVSGAAVTIDGLTITGGNGVGVATGRGGAVFYQAEGTLTIRNSFIMGNTISSDLNVSAGGGLYNSAGTLNIGNSTIANNFAKAGGGVLSNGGTLNISNSAISGNTATLFFGGGVAAYTMTISNCTIYGNTAHPLSSGGGYYSFGGNPVVNNTIIAGNFRGAAPSDVAGGANSASNNLIGDAASAGNFVNGVNGNIVGAAVNTILDTTLTDNGGPTPTHKLLPDSPAIDAGSTALAVDENNNPLTTDQRGAGFPRVSDCDAPAIVDIGAFEFQQTCNQPPLALCQNVTVSLEAACTADASINNGSYDPDSDDSITVSQSPAGPYPLGITTVTLTVMDSHGVTSSCQSAVTVIDQTAPDTSLTNTPPAISSANVSFGFTGTDNCPVGFECKLDNGAWTACTSPKSFSNLSNGAHIFQVRAKDAAGNVDPSPASYSWKSFVASCGTTLSPTSFVTASLAIPYAQPLSASPAGTYTFSLFDGTLPPGLQLVNTTGYYLLSGTPRTPGTFTFVLRAQRSNSACEAIRTYTMTIAPTVVPKVNCKILNANGSYTIHFGYENSTGAAVTIPMGANNTFTSGASNRGQTTVFQPGVVNNAFNVTFANAGAFTSWSLKGPDGVSRSVLPSVLTPNCP